MRGPWLVLARTLEGACWVGRAGKVGIQRSCGKISVVDRMMIYDCTIPLFFFLHLGV